MGPFLYNAWYVAAWSSDVGSQPLARTLLDERVVLFRQADGTVAALADRCPHRFVPLSRGKVVEGRIACGYHGLQFDGKGACVDERFGEKLKDSARLRSFPIVERHSAVWIWMGAAAAADASKIPDFAFLSPSDHQHVLHGTSHVKVHYQLEVDNLMDLTHLDYVHENTIGSGAIGLGEYKSWQEGNSVYSHWWTPNQTCPRQFVPYLHSELADQWNETRWDPPGILYLHNGATLPGAAREAGIWVHQGHFVTPETASSTHYFWGVAMPYRGEDRVAHPEFVKGAARMAFEQEDQPMLEAQQRALRAPDFWAEKPISFPWDAGAIRARRVMDQLIAEEGGRRDSGLG